VEAIGGELSFSDYFFDSRTFLTEIRAFFTAEAIALLANIRQQSESLVAAI